MNDTTNDHGDTIEDSLLRHALTLGERFVWTAKAIDAALPGYSADHWYRALVNDPTLDPDADLFHAKGDVVRQLRAENPEQVSPSTSGVWIAHKAAIDRLISAHLTDYRFPEEETAQLDAETEVDTKLPRVDWAAGKVCAPGTSMVDAMNDITGARDVLRNFAHRVASPHDIVWAGLQRAPILKVWRIEPTGNAWQYEGHAQVFAWRGDSAEARDVLRNHVRKYPTQAIVACSDDPVTRSMVMDAQGLALRCLLAQDATEEKQAAQPDDDAEFMLLGEEVGSITRRIEALYKRTCAEREIVRARRKVLDARYEWLESLLVGLDQ